MVELRPLDDGNPGQVLDTPHVADLCRNHFFLAGICGTVYPLSISYFICVLLEDCAYSAHKELRWFEIA